MNYLYYGDCLTIIREHFRLSSVDLIYLDPPFNSNRAYNAIYKTETGRPLPDQIEAFCDTWTLDAERERAIRAMPVLMRQAGIDNSVAEFWQLWMNALRNTNPRLLAYLSYMVERLIWMKGILKPTGSIYLHCDPTASHYIKIMMDGVFGHANFRNEIVWCYPPGGRGPKLGYHRKHDIIFYYGRSAKGPFNRPFQPLDAKAKAKFTQTDEEGREYKEYPGGRTYLDEIKGRPIPDWWTDIHSLGQTQSRERIGYATQKPIALLKRIIQASSNEGDTVLDPFCGCATTLEAAHTLNRRWIGIDIAIHAIKRVAAVRLSERLGLVEGQDYQLEGVPHNLEGAQLLWERDKYHFQKWAVEQSEGFVTHQRTSDGGIDGRLYFEGDIPEGTGTTKLESMILEVKGGKNVTQRDLRGLRGALSDSEACMGGLIVLVPLGSRKQANFQREMAKAGSVNIRGRAFPRLQLLTVEQLLAGERFDTPPILGRHEKAQQKLIF